MDDTPAPTVVYEVRPRFPAIQRSVLAAAVAIEVIGTEDSDLAMWLGLSEADLGLLERAIDHRLAREKE